MNKIINKLKLPGHETKVIIVPRKGESSESKEIAVSIQLSLNMEMEPPRPVKD